MMKAWCLRHRRVAAVGAIALLSVPAVLVWQAHSAVRQARERAESASFIKATILPLDRPLPAEVETIGTQAVFRDAALFAGHLFVAGPHGLVEYDANGAAVRRFRTGLELPPSGLVGLTVGVLAAGSKAELLIATASEGLLTFDGRRMLHVRPEKSEPRKLTSLLALSSGRVLLGTDKAGVLAFDGRALTPAHPELDELSVSALAGADADVWIGTMDAGVWHWRAGGVERFDESNGLPDPRVLSIATDADRTYVGTALGVAEFHAGRYVRTLGPGLFASAVAVRGDTLFIGTIDGSLAEVPLGGRASRGVRPILHDAPARVDRLVKSGGALYALAEDAVYSVEPTGGLRRVLGADAGRLTDRNVSALALDSTGRLWVGYFDRGLDILNASHELAAHVEDDRIFCVNRIVHDAAGGMTAVATANGLVLFDASGRPRQVLGRAEGLIANHVTDLVLNAAGGMTVATPAGLTFIDRHDRRSLYAFHGLVNNHVYALAAHGGEVFAGTLGGVSMLDNGAIRANYTTANSSLSHNWITAVARVDEDWFVGTYGGGVFRLDRQRRWHRFGDEATGPIEINPNAMAVTSKYVFAGTLSHGLLVFDRGTQRWSRIHAGLPSMNVTALAPDRDHLYVGTDNGLVRIRP